MAKGKKLNFQSRKCRGVGPASHFRLISSTHCQLDENTAAGRTTSSVQDLAILTNSMLLMTCPQHPPLCAERVPLSELRMFGGLVVERRERKRRRKKREDKFFIVAVRFSFPSDLPVPIVIGSQHCRW
jgi:hypothetical protein